MFMLAIFTAALFALVLIFCMIWHKRFIQYSKFPQLPPSLLWGHMKWHHEITQHGPLDRDHDHIFSEIHTMLGKPPLVLMDYRPIDRPVVFIASHEIAEQISRPTDLFRTSVPKVDMKFLRHVIGPTSILAADGEKWRSLRKKFNHGFSLQHLVTLLPTILDKTMIFVQHLDILSQTGEEIPLTTLTVNLTYDIIGAVVLNIDMAAQKMDPSQRGELVRAFTDLLDAYWDDKLVLPWWFYPSRELKRRRLGQRLDKILKSIIRSKHAEQQQGYFKGKKNQPLPVASVISLSLQDTPVLTEEILGQTCDQLRTFLLGGHDTPSTTLAWTFYELSRTPRAQSAVRAELDTLFGVGSDANAVRIQLASSTGPDLLGRMSYIAAVIKETLRLHTPASTARYSPAGTGFFIKTPSGEDLCLDDVIIYNCNSIIHRDPAVFGAKADQFIPERWLNGNADNSLMGMPSSAWRPFERGPRTCIGQEFGNIEMRVIIAVVARQYEFTKVGLGALALDVATGLPILRDDGQYEVQSHVYMTRQITARPVDGIRMKVGRRRDDEMKLV